MNITQLKLRYPDAIPDAISTHLKKFESLLENKDVLRVKVLSNFGLDVEQSAIKGYDIYKGFVIELASDYELGAKDKFWLHPQLYKTRSLYEATSSDVKKAMKTNSFDISDCASSAALYTTHAFDEIGGYKEKDFVIIDTSNDAAVSTTLSHWINTSAKMRKVYNDMHTQSVDGNTMKGHTAKLIDSIANTIGNLKQVSSAHYNVFYRSNNSFLFYNHALKPLAGSKALVHVSPLMGYAMVKSRGNAMESDLMSCSEYLDISKFNDEQRHRAYVSCKWSGKNIINTFCLRKPIENYKDWFGEENFVSYRMENGYFSNTPIVDKLDPKIVLFLTPEATQIPQEKDVHSHILKNIVKLPATDEILTKLVKNHWRQLFSKKYLSGDNLALPRELVQKII